MKAVVRRSLERLMKRRIRHRDGTTISSKEAGGLAKLAEILHEAKVDRDAALNACVARHPAGSQIEPEPVILPANLTCMACEENPALPDRVFCAVCAEVVDSLPSEPIARGAK